MNCDFSARVKYKDLCGLLGNVKQCKYLMKDWNISV